MFFSFSGFSQFLEGKKSLMSYLWHILPPKEGWSKLILRPAHEASVYRIQHPLLLAARRCLRKRLHPDNATLLSLHHKERTKGGSRKIKIKQRLDSGLRLAWSLTDRRSLCRITSSWPSVPMLDKLNRIFISQSSIPHWRRSSLEPHRSSEPPRYTSPFLGDLVTWEVYLLPSRSVATCPQTLGTNSNEWKSSNF